MSREIFSLGFDSSFGCCLQPRSIWGGCPVSELKLQLINSEAVHSETKTDSYQQVSTFVILKASVYT